MQANESYRNWQVERLIFDNDNKFTKSNEKFELSEHDVLNVQLSGLDGPLSNLLHTANSSPEFPRKSTILPISLELTELQRGQK